MRDSPRPAPSPRTLALMLDAQASPHDHVKRATAVAARLAELELACPSVGPRERRRRRGGVVKAIRYGMVKNTRWGRSLLFTRINRAKAAHDLPRLLAQLPAAHRARDLANERRRARQAWEREHPTQ